MANYYFLSTLLPPLRLGEKPEISFTEFEHLLPNFLKKKDFEKSIVLRRLIDIYNLRRVWERKPLDRRGKLEEAEFEESISMRSNFASYVYDFLDKYESVEQRLKYFPLLVHAFFQEEISRSKGFLKQYLRFEREWRLVMVGLRAKQMNRDVAIELQFEDPSDPLIAQILAQKDVKNYDPPQEYEWLKVIFERDGLRPLELEKDILEYRFNKIEELLEGDLFSINRILGYMAQLMIVDDWQELEGQKGIQIVNEMLKEEDESSINQ